MLEVGSDRSAQRARDDYVKAVYQLGAGSPVKAAELARYLAVSRVAVTKARRILEAGGLLRVAERRTEALRLTSLGRAHAVRMVRRHRLIETFLHRSLGVPLDRIHGEAERIEHVISEDVAERLAVFLERPTHDPHGHPIPDLNEGCVSAARRAAAATLADQPVGAHIEIVSLDDRDPEALRSLCSGGLLPGLKARLVAKTARSLRLRRGTRDLRVSAAHAARVRVRS